MSSGESYNTRKKKSHACTDKAKEASQIEFQEMFECYLQTTSKRPYMKVEVIEENPTGLPKKICLLIVNFLDFDFHQPVLFNLLFY